MNEYRKLKQPLELGSLTLHNRIVMAPMSRYRAKEGIPGADAAQYYKRRAEAGVGLIITESIFIDPTASYNVPDAPIFYGEKALQAWGRVADAVHQAKGEIFAQIMHSGGMRQLGDSHEPTAASLAPSPVPHPFIKDAQSPKEMNIEDIEEVIRLFAKAALQAKNYGFDGVEIHGGHGFLIDQFFWSHTNKRSDQYGSEILSERTRFASEVIQAVRESVGPDYPISFRFSQWKLGDYDAKLITSQQQLSEFLEPLTNAGVDIFHVSTRHFDAPAFEGASLSLATLTKLISGKPTIAAGSVGYDDDFVSSIVNNSSSKIDSSKLDHVEEQIANNEYDLIAIGRPLLADPNWWEKVSKEEFESINLFSKADLALYN